MEVKDDKFFYSPYEIGKGFRLIYPKERKFTDPSENEEELEYLLLRFLDLN